MRQRVAAAKCLHPSCRNHTTNADGLCYAHTYLGVGRTPGGQVSFRGEGPLNFTVRLAREQAEPIPRTTAGVEGFPYFTKDDARAYLEWRRSGRPELRPSTADILDRFPVVTREVLGEQIDGTEIGLFDSTGQLYTLVPDGAGRNVVVDEQVPTNGGWTRLYQTAYGLPYAVHQNQSYQVVMLDTETLDALARV